MNRIVSSEHQFHLDTSTDWFSDIYLDPVIYENCLVDIMQILRSEGINLNFLEVHVFPRSGFVYLYQQDGDPVESTEAVTASVLEVIKQYGIEKTTYVVIDG